MKNALLLAAAVALAACSSRAEDDTAAAPAPDDTTATTHVIDSTRTGPPGTGGRHGAATVTPDSVLDDTTQVVPDTMSATGDSPTSTPQDTLGPSVPDTAGQMDTTSSQ
ncbi:MAG TPA: hypothetical protein VH764_02845 [Gemmatimonadales bacterium]|jgi:hypothetical protein